MAYSMHRIFCATPWDLEEERQAFYSVMSEFNEHQAMPRDILFVSLSLLQTVADKRPFQSAINENIRSCRYYIQVLEDSWGPPQRDFERDFALAAKCVTDPNLPMQEAVVLFRKPLLPHKVDAPIREWKERLQAEGRCTEFDGIDEFKEHLRALLSGWLATLIAPAAIA